MDRDKIDLLYNLAWLCFVLQHSLVQKGHPVGALFLLSGNLVVSFTYRRRRTVLPESELTVTLLRLKNALGEGIAVPR